MFEPIVVKNPEFGDLRMLVVEDELYFVGKDVATALGYSNTRDVLAKHVDEEDKITVAIHDGNKGNPNVTAINESGLYSLVLSSKLPDAKKFKHWVTKEVLPAIRKTGHYSKCQHPAATVKAMDVREQNARVRMSRQFQRLAEADVSLSEHYKTILIAKAAQVLGGEEILPLPVSEQRMYTAREIGKMFGVSAQKVGRLSNRYDMKTPEYGEWYKDKSPYAHKEVDSFRYNDRAVERFRAILLGEEKEASHASGN